jgi:hypothetical protein
LWIVLVVVLVLVLDLAGFDYDYENDDEEDALRVCRRFTAPGESAAPQLPGNQWDARILLC